MVKIGMLALLVAIGDEAVGAESVQAVPVIWQVPSCEHEKLGMVTVATGRKVDPKTRDLWMPSADYSHAFAKLAEAAREKGGNAVVVRWHEATFFTRAQQRSNKPVRVLLKGAAVRLVEGGSGCELAVVDPLEFEERALKGEPVEVMAEAGAHAE